jgi:hypothetical protein
MKTDDITPAALLGYRQAPDMTIPVLALGPCWVYRPDPADRDRVQIAHDGRRGGLVLVLRAATLANTCDLREWTGAPDSRRPFNPVSAAVVEHLDQVRARLQAGELIDMRQAPEGWQWQAVRASALVATAECVEAVRAEDARSRAKYEESEHQRREAALRDRLEYLHRIDQVNRQLRESGTSDFGLVVDLDDSLALAVCRSPMVGTTLDLVELLVSGTQLTDLGPAVDLGAVVPTSFGGSRLVAITLDVLEQLLGPTTTTTGKD